MKPVHVAAIAAGLVALVITLIIVFRPKPPSSRPLPPQASCIQVPEKLQGADFTVGTELRTKLEGLKGVNASVDFEDKFRDTGKTAYQQLSDDNTTLLLLLRAIDCYRKPPNALPPENIDLLITIVRTQYRAKKGISLGGMAGPKQLEDQEKAAIASGSGSDEILTLFHAFGFKHALD